MSEPITVMLSEGEMELARRVASLRNNPKVEAGTTNHRVANRSDWRLHFDGVRAEVACGKYFGYPIDISFSFGGDDKRADLYVGEWRVEVKACTHQPPIVKFNALTDFVADVVVVAYVYPVDHKLAANVELWGCCSRHRFAKAYSQRDFGYGERAILDPSLLSPVAKLRERRAS